SVAKMNLAESLVKQLDQPASAEQANMRVVYLRNAEALKLVEVLQAVLSGEEGGTSGMSPRRNQNPQQRSQLSNQQNQNIQGGMNAAAQPLQQGGGGDQGPVTIAAGGAIIAADPSTNALII